MLNFSQSNKLNPSIYSSSINKYILRIIKPKENILNFSYYSTLWLFLNKSGDK